MKDKISVFGSTGFIGSEYCSLYEDEISRIERDNYISKSDEILYFISNMDLNSKILDVFQKMIGDIMEVYTEKKDEILTNNKKGKVILVKLIVISNLSEFSVKPGAIKKTNQGINISTTKTKNKITNVLAWPAEQINDFCNAKKQVKKIKKKKMSKKKLKY